MTEYLTGYRKYILSCLEDESCDKAKLLEYHTEKLHQFQHERLIHLIVTVLFAICTIITIIAVAVYEKLMLIPLYKDYDAMYKKVYGLSQEDLK